MWPPTFFFIQSKASVGLLLHTLGKTVKRKQVAFPVVPLKVESSAETEGEQLIGYQMVNTKKKKAKHVNITTRVGNLQTLRNQKEWLTCSWSFPWLSCIFGRSAPVSGRFAPLAADDSLCKPAYSSQSFHTSVIIDEFFYSNLQHMMTWDLNIVWPQLPSTTTSIFDYSCKSQGTSSWE